VNIFGREKRMGSADRYGGRRQGETAEQHLRRIALQGGYGSDEVAAELLVVLDRLSELESRLDGTRPR